MRRAARSREVDEYIAACSPAARYDLDEIRRVCGVALPDAAETMSYKMPALKLRRTFFYFGAFKNHIGVYPPLTDDKDLIARLEPFANDKGNLRFPLDQAIPYDLLVRAAVALAKQYGR
jgi:uncharacterized protein YdhG (YjbR/CyaY superfamily)